MGMIRIYIDNIIFSLQKSGGISVVWKEIIQRILVSNDFSFMFIEYDSAKDNFFRRDLKIKNELIHSRKSIFLLVKRYLDVDIKTKNKIIFHSSYYRISSNKYAINVTTVHDFTYEYYFSGFAKKIHFWQKKRAILKSDGIICISESTKKDLIQFIPEIDVNRIRVIYNGADEAFKKVDISKPFEKNHSFDDFEYAIYIGDRKSEYKNFRIAVESCRISKMKLLIIGGGDLTSNEIRFLNNNLESSCFKLLKNVPTKELNQYYNRAYCLLYPSNYEGFGIPVVEAQKAGCPVIATYSSSIPEVIADISMAITNPTSHKISDRMKHIKPGSKQREKIVELGIERSSVFSWDNTYYKTLDFYKHLLENSKK